MPEISSIPSVSGVSDFSRTRAVLFQSGRMVHVAMADFSDMIAMTFGFPTYTAAQIADGNHAVNTAAKEAGRAVWDTTNNRLMVASGTSQIAPWYIADGSVSVTPA